jgi:hypothetical protein
LATLRLSGAIRSDQGADRPGLKEEERKSLPGLEKLSRLKNLEVLDLSRTPVNAAGLQALGSMPKLRELRLALAPNIDDTALAVLAKWRLRTLTLEGTAVTTISK